MKRTISRLVIILTVSLMVFGCSEGSQTASSWKFAFMSDNQDPDSEIGVNTATVARLANDIKDQGVSLVIVSGDLIDGDGAGLDGLNAQYAEWIAAMAPIYNSSIPVYAVPGNHEYWCDTAENCVTAWQESIVPILPEGRSDNSTYPGREYSFTSHNAFFIGLNQNQFGDSMPAYYRGNDNEWVAEQLSLRDADSYPHVIAFGHMPQFMLQYGWSDENKTNRETLWNLLSDASAKIYLTGHSHTYALGLTTSADGAHSIYQIIAGSAGAGFETRSWDGIYYESDRATIIDRNNENEGYVLVTIDGAEVTMEWRHYDTSDGLFKSSSGFNYIQD